LRVENFSIRGAAAKEKLGGTPLGWLPQLGAGEPTFYEKILLALIPTETARRGSGKILNAIE
jgi:hypothetical protein